MFKTGDKVHIVANAQHHADRIGNFQFFTAGGIAVIADENDKRTLFAVDSSDVAEYYSKVERYFTISIPWEPDEKKRTEWHPTDPNFQPLTRGRFASVSDAQKWADEKLGEDGNWAIQNIAREPQESGSKK